MPSMIQHAPTHMRVWNARITHIYEGEKRKQKRHLAKGRTAKLKMSERKQTAKPMPSRMCGSWIYTKTPLTTNFLFAYKSLKRSEGVLARIALRSLTTAKLQLCLNNLLYIHTVRITYVAHAVRLFQIDYVTSSYVRTHMNIQMQSNVLYVRMHTCACEHGCVLVCVR